MRAVALVFLFNLISFASFSQKVAVVLSGGAAKGLAHVGVLKALEENEIPIDYIVGTSMGGVIGGCYAAGMSPNQIEEMILSENFLAWVNGRLEKGFNYYYNKNDIHPSFVKLNLSLDSTLNFSLNTGIANDLSLNFALAERMAQPSAISKNNFDSLFVPLRIMASDIFTQNQVILRKGELADALRATQTVPFFYNPIRVNGMYLYDGGVYNNFPVDVAQKEFNPPVIIGVNVSSKIYDKYPFGEDDKLIKYSLLYMLLDKSDPSMIQASGVYIQPNLKKYTAFDFTDAKAMIDSGYNQTMRQMSEIKSKVLIKRNRDEVASARNKFIQKAPPILVDKVIYTGFTENQRNYLDQFFRNGKKQLKLSDVKSGYYKLVSDDYFKTIYPSLKYNKENSKFNLLLAKRPQNNLQVDFGGVIATRNISNIFLGINYYSFNTAAIRTSANFYTGSFYKSAQVKARMDIPLLGRFYVEPEATFNSWSFQDSKDLIFKGSITTLSRIDRKIGINIGLPVGKQYKIVGHGAFINNDDKYVNTKLLISSDTLDQLRLSGGSFGLALMSNTLNKKQYANLGHSFSVSFNWFSVKETLTPGSTTNREFLESENRKWVRLKASAQQYFRTGKYSSGYLLEGVLSNQPFFSNYYGTIIYAPAFNPLQDSPTFILEKFRAFNYIAGGWRNVFSLRSNLDFRLEGYLFKPLRAIVSDDNQQPVFQDDFTKLYFTGTAGFVLHSTIGPISLSLNYYDEPKNQLGVLLHMGFLLYNKSSME